MEKNSSFSTTIQGKIISSDELRLKAAVWAKSVREQAKQNITKFDKGKRKPTHTYKSGLWKGKTEGKLKNKLSFAVREKGGVTDHVGFKFPLHGIFREYGVGRGQPRMPGKKKSRKVYIKRSMSDWLDAPISKNMNKFADLAAEFYGDEAIIHCFNAMIKSKKQP